MTVIDKQWLPERQHSTAEADGQYRTEWSSLAVMTNTINMRHLSSSLLSTLPTLIKRYQCNWDGSRRDSPKSGVRTPELADNDSTASLQSTFTMQWIDIRRKRHDVHQSVLCSPLTTTATTRGEQMRWLAVKWWLGSWLSIFHIEGNGNGLSNNETTELSQCSSLHDCVSKWRLLWATKFVSPLVVS